jgi:hypothetical protein
LNSTRSRGEYPSNIRTLYPKQYRERIEKFSRDYIWRRITGDITIEYLEAGVERMFTADEVSTVVDRGKLKELKHRIVELFLYARETRQIAGIDKKLLAARHKAAIAGNAFG